MEPSGPSSTRRRITRGTCRPTTRESTRPGEEESDSVWGGTITLIQTLLSRLSRLSFSSAPSTTPPISTSTPWASSRGAASATVARFSGKLWPCGFQYLLIILHLLDILLGICIRAHQCSLSTTAEIKPFGEGEASIQGRPLFCGFVFPCFVISVTKIC